MEILKNKDNVMKTEKNDNDNNNNIIILTNEQKEILKLIDNGENVFITGSAGVGKSFILKKIVKKETLKKKNIIITASSGVAAVNIGGSTLHSRIGLGLAELPINDLIRSALDNIKLIKRWMWCDILIIDEISMLDGSFFEKCDKIISAIKKNDKPFGGLQIILVGDFFQLPPVFDKKRLRTNNGLDNNEVITSKFCFEVETWKKLNLKIIELRTNYRQSEDNIFFECLNKIRLGIVNREITNQFNKCINQKFDISDDILPTMLYSIRSDVEKINNEHLQKLNTEEYEYNYKITVTRNEENIKDYDNQLINKIIKDTIDKAMAPNLLQLKKGAQVILLKNLAVDCGLCNGSRGIVIGFDEIDNNYPIVKFVNKTELTIIPEDWNIEINNMSTTVTYTQIPLNLAWALTIHKSQGMTIDRLSVSMNNIFEYGQTYVALSRAKCSKDLTINKFDQSLIKVNKKVKDWYEKINIENVNSNY